MSGAVACLWTICELASSTRKPIALRAAHFVILRIAIDAGVAMIAYGILIAVLGSLDWFTGPFPVLMAGACGPGIVRSQFAFLGGGDDRYFGPAEWYSNRIKTIDLVIDDISAVEQSRWMAKALPWLVAQGVTTIEIRIRTYVNGLDRLDAEERRRELDFIDEVVGDGGLKPSEKIEQLVQRMLDIGGRRQVRSLTKR